MHASSQLVCAPASLNRSHSWQWVARFIGLLLLVTALLKAEALRAGTMSLDPILHSNRAIIAVVMLEVTLAAWLLITSFAGGGGVFAWLASLSFFSIAFLVAFFTGLFGVSHCPCFGSAKVSPWWAVILDASVLLSLIVVRPGGIPQVIALAIQKLRQLSRVEKVLASIAGIGVLAAILIVRFPPDWLVKLRGESLVMTDDAFYIGAGQNQEWTTVSVSVRNVSSKPVTIIGGTSNCSCVAISALPATIGARERLVIPIRVKYAGTAGYFSRHFTLFTDSEATQTVSGVIAGRVAE